MATFNKKPLTNTAPTFISYKNTKAGSTIVTGKLVKIEVVPGYKGRGTVPKYTFETDEGITILNSAGQLNYFLNKAENVGKIFEVVYLGKEPFFDKKTKKMSEESAHKFSVVELEEICGE